MSCGLTVITSVLAFFAASSALSTGTPYVVLSSTARSARRTTTATSDGARPARSSPDSSASPIFPAPSIAIMKKTIANAGRTPGSPGARPADGPGSHTSHRRTARRPGPARRPTPAGAARQAERAGDRDQPRVVRGDHRVAGAFHQDPQAARERLVDVVPRGERLGRGL